MSWGWNSRPYVSAAQKRLRAQKAVKVLEKNGQKMNPVRIDGRSIARSFWGKAWCENLESYSDYANRLPRGRTYVRNGSVIDFAVVNAIATPRPKASRVLTMEARMVQVLAVSSDLRRASTSL